MTGRGNYICVNLKEPHKLTIVGRRKRNGNMSLKLIMLHT